MKFANKNSSEVLEGDSDPHDRHDVFQLIAFFMLLINFLRSRSRRRNHATQSSALAIPPEVRPDYQIILNLNPDGTVIKFEGQPIARIDLPWGRSLFRK